MISNNDLFVIKRIPKAIKLVVEYNRADRRYWRKIDEKILEDVRDNYPTEDKKEKERFKTEFDKLSKKAKRAIIRKYNALKNDENDTNYDMFADELKQMYKNIMITSGDFTNQDFIDMSPSDYEGYYEDVIYDSKYSGKVDDYNELMKHMNQEKEKEKERLTLLKEDNIIKQQTERKTDVKKLDQKRYAVLKLLTQGERRDDVKKLDQERYTALQTQMNVNKLLQQSERKDDVKKLDTKVISEIETKLKPKTYEEKQESKERYYNAKLTLQQALLKPDEEMNDFNEKYSNKTFLTPDYISEKEKLLMLGEPDDEDKFEEKSHEFRNRFVEPLVETDEVASGAPYKMYF